MTYLGVIICKDEKMRSDLNFDPIIRKTNNRFNMWLQRDLSLQGRVLLSKAEGISRSGYVCLSLDLPSKVVKTLDKLLFDFIWKRKPHYLRKEIVCNSKDNGGLEVLNYDTLNNVFKINWITQYLKKKDNMWNTFPNFLFKSVGGLEFLLKCNYCIDKIPVKRARFHQQALRPGNWPINTTFPLEDIISGITEIFYININHFF